MTSLRIPRLAALVAITVLVLAASAASFSESYRGLFLWAHHHGLSGIWAAMWPCQVDVFIAVGELALFVALADGWSVRSRGAAWTVTLLGLAASVAGNVGHVAGHDLASRATAAVPPLAAAAALAVGLGVLKRVVAKTAVASAQEPVNATEATAETVISSATVNRPVAPEPRQLKATRRRQSRVRATDIEALARAALARQPDISGADLGRAIGASPRTGQRLLSRLGQRDVASASIPA
jgi:hypothetical protein